MDYRSRHNGGAAVICANGFTFDEECAEVLSRPEVRETVTVIGVNGSYELLWPDYHCCQDNDWFFPPGLFAMGQLADEKKLFSRPEHPAFGVPIKNPEAGTSQKPDWWKNWSWDLLFGIGPGNTAYFALQLACWLGLGPLITFVGLDQRMPASGEAKGTHSYGFHRDPQDEKKFAEQREQFRYGAGVLAAAGYVVYNSSPRSKLDCFPFVSLEDFLI